jgi:hypothetical protein
VLHGVLASCSIAGDVRARRARDDSALHSANCAHNVIPGRQRCHTERSPGMARRNVRLKRIFMFLPYR